MIRIEPSAWEAIKSAAVAAYPDECCGVMLGSSQGKQHTVQAAVPLENVFEGSRRERYEIRPADLIEAEREARRRGSGVVGIFHSHPDCDAYFSETDLKNSCPWYSFLVVSVAGGRVVRAACFRPNQDLTAAEEELLIYPGKGELMAKVLIPTPLRQYADNQDTVELTGGTVGEVLAELTSRYGGLKRHMYSEEGRLRSFVNVYVNDEDIRYLKKEATALAAGDTISIVPSVAGGRHGG